MHPLERGEGIWTSQIQAIESRHQVKDHLADLKNNVALIFNRGPLAADRAQLLKEADFTFDPTQQDIRERFQDIKRYNERVFQVLGKIDQFDSEHRVLNSVRCLFSDVFFALGIGEDATRVRDAKRLLKFSEALEKTGELPKPQPIKGESPLAGRIQLLHKDIAKVQIESGEIAKRPRILTKQIQFILGIGEEAKKYRDTKKEMAALKDRIMAFQARQGEIEALTKIAEKRVRDYNTFTNQVCERLENEEPNTDSLKRMNLWTEDPTKLDLLEAKFLKGESIDVQEIPLRELSELNARLASPGLVISKADRSSIQGLEIFDINTIESNARDILRERLLSLRKESPEAYQIFSNQWKLFALSYKKSWEGAKPEGVSSGEYFKTYLQSSTPFRRILEPSPTDLLSEQELDVYGWLVESFDDLYLD